jgi:hypothetical protein
LSEAEIQQMVKTPKLNAEDNKEKVEFVTAKETLKPWCTACRRRNR